MSLNLNNIDNMDNIAKIIAELYNDPRVKNFTPVLNNKGKKQKKNSSEKTKYIENMNNINNLYIHYEYSFVPDRETIGTILKKTIQANIPPKCELTLNGKKRDDMKKGIDILKPQINNVIANNKNGEQDFNLEKMKKQLSIFEEAYKECLEIGNFEIITNYKQISIDTLILLSEASKDLEERKKVSIWDITEIEKKAKKLKNAIYKNLGAPLDGRSKKEINDELEDFDPNIKGYRVYLDYLLKTDKIKKYDLCYKQCYPFNENPMYTEYQSKKKYFDKMVDEYNSKNLNNGPQNEQYKKKQSKDEYIPPFMRTKNEKTQNNEIITEEFPDLLGSVSQVKHPSGMWKNSNTLKDKIQELIIKEKCTDNTNIINKCNDEIEDEDDGTDNNTDWTFDNE
jgi:hypothetical protein